LHGDSETEIIRSRSLMMGAPVQRLPIYTHSIVIVVTIGVWLAFRPALMSPDSIAQYREALTGEFTDWHSPAMSFFIRLALLSGLGLSGLMLIQSLAMSYGVFCLARSTIRLWGDRKTNPSFTAAAAASIFVLLMTPFSPLLFYSMTLWKDAWLMVVFLWIGVASIRLCSSDSDASDRNNGWSLAALILLMALALLLRQNALPLVVPFAVLLALLARRRKTLRRGAFLFALLPLVIAQAGKGVLSFTHSVQQTHTIQSAMALDLVGMIIRNRELCADFPVTCAHLRPDYEARYLPGHVTPLMWDSDSILPLEFITPERNEALRTEYERAIVRHPLTLAKVKTEAYLRLLKPEIRYTFQTQMTPNDLGIEHHSETELIRRLLTGVAARVSSSPLRWMFGIHLVWLSLGVARLLMAAYRIRRTHDSREVFIAVILTIALIYALTFLAATLAHDFRYLYPATLLIQILFLSELAVWMYRSRARNGSRGSAPADIMEGEPSAVGARRVTLTDEAHRFLPAKSSLPNLFSE
jgi:hypothetical protein